MAQVEQQLVSEEVEEELIGPTPQEVNLKPRKRKKCEFENVYLDNLPSSISYEKSLMHRDTIGFVTVTKTSFLITASLSGHVKFWKKIMGDIEFVKQFRAHSNTIVHVDASDDGLYYCTISHDKTLKIFDVVNFDMINMFRLGYTPDKCCWIYRQGQPITALAISQGDTGTIRVYDSKESTTVLKQLNIHTCSISSMAYNPVDDVVVSCDTKGMIEYWSSYDGGCEFPDKVVSFEYKTDTDLFDLLKTHCYALAITFSLDGKKFAVFTSDRQVFVFWFRSGLKYKLLDESMNTFVEEQQKNRNIPDYEFGRRLAVEKEMDKSSQLQYTNLAFDESGNFLIIPSMVGVKIINLVSNTCARLMGRDESVRFLQIALYQGKPNKSKATLTLEMQTAENPGLNQVYSDPCIFCTGYKKNRFYIFSRKEPESIEAGENERDIFNEKPTRDEIAASIISGTNKILPTAGIIHTTVGDIFFELFPKECPKAVENFTTHSRNNYYNNHIFHRVIRQFMIQTGDPCADGTGGESIWGQDFEDEFDPKLKHDKPYTMSMANAGPDSNGSQFFITVASTPWLDNKHTIFGRVIKGMEVVQYISQVPTNEHTDKPFTDIKIVSITIK